MVARGEAGETLSVCIAVPTCDRPETLGLLLKSLAGQKHPAACRLNFVVVDNGREIAADAVVEAKRSLFEDQLDLIHEPRPGIPFGRNRALDHALANGADLLLFLDDDEEADSGWLAALVAHYRECGAHLIGGPVFARPPPSALTPWQRYLLRGIERWYVVRQSRNARRARRGRERQIVVITNNWLLDIAFQRRSGIRFDESLRIEGGSDVRFFHDAVRAGARTGWCPHARVYEFIDAGRLSARYIAFRGQQQTIGHFQRRAQGARVFGVARQIAAAPLLLMLGIIRLLLAPLLGAYSFVDGCRLCGRASGKILSVFGVSARIYKDGTRMTGSRRPGRKRPAPSIARGSKTLAGPADDT